ncbi:hypothetical protein BGZ61DRAFT_76401 [Ilyonectria robusta]|uniref:uncharacterized protein n=1 Tax=Ilyonectria robusta TaxID=1079257 RepID=UPI001E8EAF75|nr:uncharacterized protein BGZ61DRAFT_76401 [Ilyonectria robusta]KAH8677217.1 hypothetical protein BGZ61DRAFT_76401 [Ilyonectria robusta]
MLVRKFDGRPSWPWFNLVRGLHSMFPFRLLFDFSNFTKPKEMSLDSSRLNSPVPCKGTVTQYQKRGVGVGGRNQRQVQLSLPIAASRAGERVSDTGRSKGGRGPRQERGGLQNMWRWRGDESGVAMGYRDAGALECGYGEGMGGRGTVTGRHFKSLRADISEVCLAFGRDIRGMGEIGRIPDSAVSRVVVTRRLGVLAAAIPSTPGTVSFLPCQLPSQNQPLE